MVYSWFISSYHMWEKQLGYEAISQFTLASSKLCYLDTTYVRQDCNLASLHMLLPMPKSGEEPGYEATVTNFPHHSY